jgi:hypothetical protein
MEYRHSSNDREAPGSNLALSFSYVSEVLMTSSGIRALRTLALQGSDDLEGEYNEQRPELIELSIRQTKTKIVATSAQIFLYNTFYTISSPQVARGCALKLVE